MTTPKDPYASEAETQALLVPDTRTEAERKLAQMMTERGADEQGAEAYPILRQIAADLLAKQTAPTVESNSQDWKGMNGETAWHLIDRHAYGWADVGKMMGEWLLANQALAEQPAPVQHADDQAVDRFAVAMKDKLSKAREKGRSGWETCPPEDLSRMLREHVEKGDPRDVANFCMMLWMLDAGIAAAPQPAQHPKTKQISECLAVLRPTVKGKFPHEQALEELVGYIAAPQPAQQQKQPAPMQDPVAQLKHLGAVPSALKDHPAITALERMAESICIIDKRACWDHVDMFKVRDEICAALQANRTCTWSPSGDPNAPGTWAASCGAMWTFTDGGPVENDVHFCQKCGGALQIEGADDAGA